MFPTLTAQDIYRLSTVKQHALGTIFYLPTVQGKKGFRYVAFGGTATINPGLLLVAPAAPANSTGLALNAANNAAQLVAGSRSLVVTNGATAVVQDQFADGQLEVVTAAGIYSVTIAGNSAAAAAGQIIVSLAEPLSNPTALIVGTNTVNLRPESAYLAVPSLTQSNPVGVTVVSVPNTAAVTNYGFVQISGPTAVSATTATKGYPIVQDTAGTAGYVANTGSNLAQIGIARESVVSGLASVNLQLN